MNFSEQLAHLNPRMVKVTILSVRISINYTVDSQDRACFHRFTNHSSDAILNRAIMEAFPSVDGYFGCHTPTLFLQVKFFRRNRDFYTQIRFDATELWCDHEPTARSTIEMGRRIGPSRWGIGSHTGIVFTRVPTTRYTNLMDLPSSETDMIISDIPDISEISNQSGGGETQWITNNRHFGPYFKVFSEGYNFTI
jgi:hypothetical protein